MLSRRPRFTRSSNAGEEEDWYLGYTASGGRMSDESERLWKGVFKAIS
jgi:hypothetical protein